MHNFTYLLHFPAPLSCSCMINPYICFLRSRIYKTHNISSPNPLNRRLTSIQNLLSYSDSPVHRSGIVFDLIWKNFKQIQIFKHNLRRYLLSSWSRSPQRFRSSAIYKMIRCTIKWEASASRHHGEYLRCHWNPSPPLLSPPLPPTKKI